MRLALLAHDIGGGGGAAAARLVGHLEAHRRELLLVDDGNESAREHVIAGAGAAMHDEFDRPRRLEFGTGGSERGEHQQHRRSGENMASQHGFLQTEPRPVIRLRRSP